VTAGWSTTPLTKQPEQWFDGGGKTAMGLTAGEITWIRGRTGGARFTGVSASLKAVSGKSGRGMTDTQTAAASRKKTNVKRNRITSLRPSRKPRPVNKLIPQVGVVNVDLEGGAGRWTGDGGRRRLDIAAWWVCRLSTFFLSFSTTLAGKAGDRSARQRLSINKIGIYFHEAISAVDKNF